MRATVRRRPEGPGRTVDAGFTLVQMVIFLALVALAAGLLLPLGSQLLSTHRTSATRDQLQRVKTAMVGDREVAGPEGRTSFGFLGDIGSLPDSLPDLIRQGNLPDHSVSGDRRIGAGWKGPYPPVGLEEDTADALVDAFGRSLVFLTQDTVVDGVTWDGRVVSAGPDGSVGTDDDILVPVRRDETTATVRGQLLQPDGETPNPNASVTLSYRRDGAFVDSTKLTDSEGRFSFDGMPQGKVLVRILGPAAAAPDSGELKLMPGSQVSSSQGGRERVAFQIFNSGQVEIVVKEVTVEYGPTAFYRIIESRRAGQGPFKTLFDAEETEAPWPGSGDLVRLQTRDTIPPVTGSISRVALRYLPLVLDGPVADMDTIHSPPTQVSGTTIRLVDFRRNDDGSGPPVNMGGVTFTVTFNDGSTMTFTTPQ